MVAVPLLSADADVSGAVSESTPSQSLSLSGGGTPGAGRQRYGP